MNKVNNKNIQNLLYHNNYNQNKRIYILNSRSKTTNPTNNWRLDFQKLNKITKIQHRNMKNGALIMETPPYSLC